MTAAIDRDAALAGRGAHPGRPGAAAQRRLPGRPRAARRAAAGPGARRPAARAARHRAGPGGGGRLAPARRRRAAVPAVAAGPRARRHVRLPGARGRGAAAGRHRHVHLRARAGARLRAVHRRAQHRAAGRGGLDRGLGRVPGRAAGPGQRAGRPTPTRSASLRGGPRRVPAPARPPPASPPVDADRRRAAGRGRGHRARDGTRSSSAGSCAPGSAVRVDGGTALVTGPAGAFAVAVDRAPSRCCSTAASRPVAAGFGSHRRRAGADLPGGRGPAGPGQHGLEPRRGRAIRRERHEAGRAAGQRRSGRGARRAPPRDRPDRGAGPHRGLGDLPGHRSGRSPRWPRSSLLAKARARPDLVRQVVRKAQAEGIAATAQAVRGRLASDVPLGYSAAGVVARGRRRRRRDRAGQLVATGGAGKASHAEFQAVPGLLCAVVPDAVPAQDAAFATLASIPLHALRLSGVGPGRQGRGARPRADRPARGAAGDGLRLRRGRDRPRRVRQGDRGQVAASWPWTSRVTRPRSRSCAWSRGRGADAVLVCAADSSAGPMSRAPALCRDRAAVVMVGDVGMPPQPDPVLRAGDLPAVRPLLRPGPVRAVLRGVGGRLPGRAGALDRGPEPGGRARPARRGAACRCPTWSPSRSASTARMRPTGCWRSGPSRAWRSASPIPAAADRGRAGPAAACAPSPAADRAEPGVGWIGAGAFSTGTLLPAFREAGFERFVAVATASGVSARRAAERHGFEKAVTGADAVIDDPDVSVVVIATPHDTHAELARQALAAGRDVWCEKPLALTCDDLDEVEKAWRGSGRQLTLGFNRRWAPAVLAAQRALAEVTAPKLVVYRIAAGRVPGRPLVSRPAPGRAPARRGVPFRRHSRRRSRAPTSRTRRACWAGTRPAGTTASRWRCGSRTARSPSIAYGSTPPVAGKERIEVLAGSHQVVIDDFRSVLVDGRSGGRAARTRATAPTPPRSGRRCRAARTCRPRRCWAPCAPPSRPPTGRGHHDGASG